MNTSFPTITLPDVDDASRAIIAEAKSAAADRAVRRERALRSLIATGKHVYTGTVSFKEKAARRAANKRAGIARRAARA